MKITIGPVLSKIDREHIAFAREILKFKKRIYIRRQYGGKYKEVWQKVIDTDTGEYLTGFTERLVKKARDHGESIEFEVSFPSPVPSNTTFKGENLYPHQELIEKKALERKRGIIIAGTGGGKTVSMFSIISRFPKHNSLIIVQTKDLLYQTVEKAKKYFKDCGTIGDGIFDPKQITVGLINSLNRLGKDRYFKTVSLVLLDEAHSMSKFDGMYSSVLMALDKAPLRFGFTGSYPPDVEARMALEGYFGPIIAKIGSKELIEKEILSKPKVRLIQLPEMVQVKNLRKWTDIYERGVVNNKTRNELICEQASDLAKMGDTSLIVCSKIEHIRNLYEIFTTQYPDVLIGVAYGDTDSEERMRIKNLLDKKQISVAITSTIWKAGIDIPSLNCVINAAASKSEIFTLQTLGRGMRSMDGKDTFLIVDFFDSSSTFFISHFGHRICLYMSEGWMD